MDEDIEDADDISDLVSDLWDYFADAELDKEVLDVNLHQRGEQAHLSVLVNSDDVLKHDAVDHVVENFFDDLGLPLMDFEEIMLDKDEQFSRHE